LDLAVAGPGLGPPPARPAIPLVALRERVGLPVVHPAPDDHRGRRRVVGVAAAGAVAGAPAAGGRYRLGVRADHRVRGPPGRLAAPDVRDEADGKTACW